MMDLNQMIVAKEEDMCVCVENDLNAVNHLNDVCVVYVCVVFVM